MNPDPEDFFEMNAYWQIQMLSHLADAATLFIGGFRHA
jgi:hypothetical protein